MLFHQPLALARRACPPSVDVAFARHQSHHHTATIGHSMCTALYDEAELQAAPSGITCSDLAIDGGTFIGIRRHHYLPRLSTIFRQSSLSLSF
jgi:hypothetical protein